MNMVKEQARELVIRFGIEGALDIARNELYLLNVDGYPQTIDHKLHWEKIIADIESRKDGE